MQTLRRAVVGLAGGLALGAFARCWMRLLTNDPEFSWSGTLFIVIGFGFFGLLQTVPRAVRRNHDSGWRVGASRVVGGIGMVPLFAAAGAVMLPTVLAGGGAIARPRLAIVVRIVALAIAAAPFVLIAVEAVDESGWSLDWMLGLALMVVTYATIIAMAMPTLTPSEYRHRWAARLMGLVGLALVAASMLLVIGFALGD